MSAAHSYSGIECVGEIPWGSHFCQFYKTGGDLIDSLVPYFKAGLDNGEKCLWVTCEPLRAHEARDALRNAVPDLAKLEKCGQLEIIDHTEWYQRSGVMSTESVLQGWCDIEEEALARGYQGLRLTGNTFWIERADWQPFADYESRVSETFGKRRIIGLCSYCLERCHSEGMLDVVRNHEFAVVRRAGDWEMIESSSLKRAKHELSRLNAELETRVLERTAQLEKMLELRDEFLSVASHELKTPIASLKLYLDGLLRMQTRGPVAPEELNRRLRKAEAQCGRLDTLVTNLLDISRAGDTKLPLKLEELDLVQVTRDVSERFSDQARNAGCSITLRTPVSMIGQWDRLRIDQVLTNLVANAIKYAPGTDIELSIAGRQGKCQLSVSDQGPGIPKEEHERIFERFSQVSRQESAGGFGLGLWIVKQIVEALNGSISISSAPGKGTAFTVELSRA